jgi:ketosteroid isomerase-like protein
MNQESLKARCFRTCVGAVAVILAVSISAVALGAAAVMQDASTTQRDQAAVFAAARAWTAGYLGDDKAAVAAALAPEWTFQSGETVVSRADALDAFESGPRYLNFKLSDEQVTVYGAVAVYRAREEMTVSDRRTSEKLTVKSDVVDVFVKREGKWLALTTVKRRL